jgi:hypothetical protein
MNAPSRNCGFCVTKSSHQPGARRPPRFAKRRFGGPPAKRIPRRFLVQSEALARAAVALEIINLFSLSTK